MTLIMCESNDIILKKYRLYLESLAKNNSTEVFSNGGKDFASILMAILFKNTQNEIRIFCEGFKPDLIMTQPYFSELKEYLNDGKKELKVLVEDDTYRDMEPLLLLKEEKSKRNNDTILYKKVSETDKELIFKTLGNNHCNFAVFDTNKFRLEYDPVNYKAFGSFNNPQNCKILIDLFDNAFSNASII